MRVNREAFGLVISEIARAGNETDTELVLTDTTADPVKTHINRLRHFGVMVELERPTAHSLSVYTSVGGWG